MLCALAVAAGSPAIARDNVWKPAQDNTVWRAECGACHMAFPPGLLTADDWLDLMSRLDQHFGVDASLEPRVKAEISDYLQQNGDSSRLFGSRDEVPRITTSERFLGKHRSAIRLWRKGQIKTLVDCAACHTESMAAEPRRQTPVP
jgi:mono/diheme cytochrome c family protein